MSNPHTPSPPCPGGCDHTIAEHTAFTAGWAAAVAGLPRALPLRIVRQRSMASILWWHWAILGLAGAVALLGWSICRVGSRAVPRPPQED